MPATAYIEGIAIWSPWLPGWDDTQRILRGEVPIPQAMASRPSPQLLPPNERRRATDTVAVSLEVASKACSHAGRDPASLPCIFASTHGDIAITDYMCETLAQTPDLLSPTKFHNSVHNAAAGYWAIATGCMAPYTALSANQYTFGNGLLEALIQVQSDNCDILYVAYDTEACGPLATMTPSTGRLGCALVLSPEPSDKTRFALNWQTLEEDAPQDVVATDEYASLVAGNAMASCLAMFEALSGTGGRVTCAIGPKMTLEISLEAQERTSLQTVTA
jgi:hypothetical protein